MIPQSFEYFCPETVSEAIALLHEHGEGAKILSGGQSLIPMMKMRLARPDTLSISTGSRIFITLKRKMVFLGSVG